MEKSKVKTIEKVYLLSNNRLSFTPTTECNKATYVSNFPCAQKELEKVFENKIKTNK